MAEKVVTDFITTNTVAVFTKSWCGYCNKLKELFNKLKVPYKHMDLDTRDDGDSIQKYLASKTGVSTVPQVFIGGQFIGGCDDTHALHRSGKLKEVMKQNGIEISS